jgi:hypothetical protein
MPTEESETDLSALEDEVVRKTGLKPGNDGSEDVFRWRAGIVNSMRGALDMLDL